MKEYLQRKKQELKCMATGIRHTRLQFKESQRSGESFVKQMDLLSSLNEMCWKFRHMHIVYCEFRGTPREAIEKPKPENMPDERYISIIEEEYEAALCVSAA